MSRYTIDDDGGTIEVANDYLNYYIPGNGALFYQEDEVVGSVKFIVGSSYIQFGRSFENREGYHYYATKPGITFVYQGYVRENGRRFKILLFKMKKGDQMSDKYIAFRKFASDLLMVINVQGGLLYDFN